MSGPLLNPARHAWPATRLTLIHRIRSQTDEDAWQAFVTLYRPLLYRYCRRRGMQDADAQDVAQNVLQRVHGALPQFEYDPGRGRFRGWLGKIAQREMQRYRQEAHGDVGPLPQSLPANGSDDCDSTWHETFYAYAMQVALRRAQGEFRQEIWHAFEEMWLKDRSPAEVAAELRRRAEWAYQVKYRVLRRMRQIVALLLDDEPPLHS